MSVTQAMGKDKYGNITKNGIQERLNQNAGDGETEVIENIDTLVVKFIDSNRYYEINKNGDISEPIEVGTDEYAGDLTKGGKCDGSDNKPFEINCIEDLVTFSIMTNGGNSELGISSSDFSEKYVVLNKTLDFKSIFSYNDYKTTRYGDLNNDGIIEDIRTELTKTDDNCIGFTPVGNVETFSGIFDGKNNEIWNLYENRGENKAGLFANNAGTIQNIGLVNTTLKASEYIGVIAATSNYSSKISYCYIDGNTKIINDAKSTGGIVGYIGGNCTIENCYSKGNIEKEGNKTFGGIAGTIEGVCNIKRCYNIMNITLTGKVCGIIGEGWGARIEECYNIGNITSLSNSTAAGISGGMRKHSKKLL